MRTINKRPTLRVHSRYVGNKPFIEAYADMFALLLQSKRLMKSSIRTFDTSKPFHYDSDINKKGSDFNGTTD